MDMNNVRILYVGDEILAIRSGSDRLNYRNILLINSVTNGHCEFVHYNPKYSFFDKLSCRVGGVTYCLTNAVLSRLSNETFDFVFFSSSIQGGIIKKVKKRNPLIKIICNFHNIDKQYVSEMLRVKGWKYFPFYLIVSRNERLACNYMDYSLVLNARDAFLMKSIYNKDADLVLPIANEDDFDLKSALNEDDSGDIIYLFVGVSFFANIEAVEWFIKNVLPHIPGKLIIVGKGMDQYRVQFKSSKVEVHGFVDDLSTFYYKANFFISPILSGGGMKTKIAEALMYGKTILGSTESFQGYAVDSKSMFLCNSAQDYIDTINNLIANGKAPVLNHSARNLFLSSYSIDSITNKFNLAIKVWRS